MAMSTPVRRSIYVLVLALILAAAAYYLMEFLDDTEERDAAPAPVETAVVEPGVSTQKIVEEITAQATRRSGAAVTVTCPPKIELKTDQQMTCQMLGVDGAPLPDIVVTITDPGAAKGAKYRWAPVS